MKVHWALPALLPVVVGVVCAMIFTVAGWSSTLVHQDDLHYVDSSQYSVDYNIELQKLNKLDARMRQLQVDIATLTGKLEGANVVR